MRSEVEKRYVKGINSIKTQKHLKSYLDIMALHPYTDFANAAILMVIGTDVGMYHSLFEDECGKTIPGYAYDPATNEMVPSDYTYYDIPGPKYNRKMIECNLGLYSVNADSEFSFDLATNAICYPRHWREEERAEALFGLLYDLYCCEGSEASYYRNCVVYMMMKFAGYNPYLPSMTYKDIKSDNRIVVDAFCHINIKYQFVFRLAYGLTRTPLEHQLSKGASLGNKFRDSFSYNYHKALKHICLLPEDSSIIGLVE